MKHYYLGLGGLLLLASRGHAQSVATVSAEVDAVYPHSEALYFDLHRHPELSFHEQQTAAKLAAELRGLGGERPGTDATCGDGSTVNWDLGK
jgi:metal-dependent amidase/aminoacylase/carboxypeptidase family protein